MRMRMRMMPTTTRIKQEFQTQHLRENCHVLDGAVVYIISQDYMPSWSGSSL